jgi:hypothetical protein
MLPRNRILPSSGVAEVRRTGQRLLVELHRRLLADHAIDVERRAFRIGAQQAPAQEDAPLAFVDLTTADDLASG